MKYMLIAGEASGDLHASNLINSIKKLDPQAEFRFLGGDLMTKAARRNPEIHYDQMNVMGFTEVLRRLPRLMKNLRIAKKVIAEFRPDVLILVDYPSFNLKLAKYAHSLGVRVDYYISPKVWAWKEYRVKKIKKWVDNLYSILPFEVDFYKKHAYGVTYVGNPSVNEIDYALGHLPPRRHFVERQGLAADDRPIIAILPGSRKSEIRNNLPLMIAAAKRFPEYQYAVAAAPSVPEKFYREVAQDPGLQVVFDATPTLLKYSRAALVTSGTATLETALIGTPQVVCYRGNGSRLTYRIMKKILKVEYVSLPNLVVKNSIVPELLLYMCTPDAIARELSPLLQQSPRREFQIAGYKNVRRRLGNSDAADYAAELIVDSLRRKVERKEEEKNEQRYPRRRQRQRAQNDDNSRKQQRTDDNQKRRPDNGQKPQRPENARREQRNEGGQKSQRPENARREQRNDGGQKPQRPESARREQRGGNGQKPRPENVRKEVRPDNLDKDSNQEEAVKQRQQRPRRERKNSDSITPTQPQPSLADQSQPVQTPDNVQNPQDSSERQAPRRPRRPRRRPQGQNPENKQAAAESKSEDLTV